MSQNKKVILIGMDGLMPEQIERYRDDIPELNKILENGFFAPAYSSPYTDTATNWPTIATGAWVGTHGCTGFDAHLPGMELGETTKTFNSHLCQAEYYWHAAERQGKRCILLNYPCAFPKLLKNGVVVGGDGLNSKVWKLRGSDLLESHLEEIHYNGLLKPNRIILKTPGEWKNIPPEYTLLREGVVRMGKQGSFDWNAAGVQAVDDANNKDDENAEYRYMLIFKNNDKIQVLISHSRDMEDRIAILQEGQWSGWVRERFNGRPCMRQYKLLDINNEGTKISIYGTMASATEGWGYPEGIEEKIIKNAGGYVEALELEGASLLRSGNFDRMYMEIMQLQSEFMIDCSKYLNKTEDWDTMWIQYHAPDGLNHAFLRYLESNDEAVRSRADKLFRQMLALLFKMADRIVQNCADENTVVCIVSDHGNLPKTHVILPDIMMQRKGWLKLKNSETDGRNIIDTKASKACSSQLGVWINLKGREKYGCVNPGKEYEDLRTEIIEALLSMRDPDTGQCPFSLVGRREDFAGMGLYGDRVEDIVFFPRTNYFNLGHMQPGYQYHEDYFKSGRDIVTLDDVIEHKMLWNLTAVHWGLPQDTAGYASNRAVLILSGPGVKKNTKGEKRVNLVDVSPTLAYIMGIRPPSQSEGRIVWEAFD